MRLFRSAALAAFACAAAPVMAGEMAGSPTPCWDYGNKAGLFDWQQAPSTACRAGQTVAGTPVAPVKQTAPVTMAKAEAPSTTAETTFTFSGKAYLGVAVAF